MGFWTLITNLILLFHNDVILTLHDALMTSFLIFFLISKTTCARIVGVAPNDAECMISYLVFNVLYRRICFRKRLNPEKRFCTRSFTTDHIIQFILYYARNHDILVTNTNNPSYNIEKRFRTLKQLARVSQRVCGGGGGLIQFFFFFQL